MGKQAQAGTLFWSKVLLALSLSLALAATWRLVSEVSELQRVIESKRRSHQVQSAQGVLNHRLDVAFRLALEQTNAKSIDRMEAEISEGESLWESSLMAFERLPEAIPSPPEGSAQLADELKQIRVRVSSCSRLARSSLLDFKENYGLLGECTSGLAQMTETLDGTLTRLESSQRVFETEMKSLGLLLRSSRDAGNELRGAIRANMKALSELERKKAARQALVQANDLLRSERGRLERLEARRLDAVGKRSAELEQRAWWGVGFEASVRALVWWFDLSTVLVAWLFFFLVLLRALHISGRGQSLALRPHREAKKGGALLRSWTLGCSQNWASLASDGGEPWVCLHRVSLLRSRRLDLCVPQPNLRGALLARLLHGAVVLNRFESGSGQETLELVGSSPVGRFASVEVLEGRRLVLDLSHFAGIVAKREDLGSRVRFSTCFRSVWKPSFWAWGHPVACTVSGPCEVILYAEGLQKIGQDSGDGEALLVDQLLCFGDDIDAKVRPIVGASAASRILSAVTLRSSVEVAERRDDLVCRDFRLAAGRPMRLAATFARDVALTAVIVFVMWILTR